MSVASESDAVMQIIARMNTDAEWSDPGTQKSLREALSKALQLCSIDRVKVLLEHRTSYFTYDGDACDFLKWHCRQELERREKLAKNPVGKIPADVQAFFGDTQFSDDAMRAIAESTVLQEQVRRAVAAGFQFGGDPADSKKPKANEAFTDRRNKKIYIPRMTSDPVRTLVFEIQNALSDTDFSTLERGAADGALHGSDEGAASAFATSVADIEMRNVNATKAILDQAASQTKIPEAHAPGTSRETHLNNIAIGKLTIRQDYESAFFKIAKKKIEEELKKELPVAEREKFNALLKAVEEKLAKYAALAEQQRSIADND